MIVLLSLLILDVIATVAALHIPRALRLAAAHLMARAEALEAYARAHKYGLQGWRGTLGVEQEALAEADEPRGLREAR